MIDLWCIWAVGPDDLIAAPSQHEAERGATKLKEAWALRERDGDDPEISFVVQRWPYSETSHAADVKHFYEETGLQPEGKTESEVTK